jgi:hypothetical protein
MAWNSILFLSCLVFVSWKCTAGYYVVVDAHADECFFEKLTTGTKLLLTFEVIEGGFLDIDVKVKTLILQRLSSHKLYSSCCLLFRSLDLIKKKSIVAIENQAAKQHSQLTWMVRLPWICQQGTNPCVLHF